MPTSGGRNYYGSRVIFHRTMASARGLLLWDWPLVEPGWDVGGQRRKVNHTYVYVESKL